MANIADNLKRLLGTEGHNIQEVLENADSIGGGTGDIPMIEFTVDDDSHWHVSQTVGFEDAETYAGMCIIKTNTFMSIGNAADGIYCIISGANESALNIGIISVHDGAVDSYDYELQLS